MDPGRSLTHVLLMNHPETRTAVSSLFFGGGWVVYEAKRYGVELGDEVWKTLQERAYTSPIWYAPGE